MKIFNSMFALILGLGTLQTASAGSGSSLVETMTGINGLVNVQEWRMDGSNQAAGSYLVDVLNPNLNIWAIAVSTAAAPEIRPWQSFSPGWDARYFSASAWETETGFNFASMFGPDDTGVHIYGVSAEEEEKERENFSNLAALDPLLLNDSNDQDFTGAPPGAYTGFDADFYYGALPASEFVAFDQNFQIIDRSLAEAIPTPTALFLMAGGLLGLALRRR